MLQLAKCRLRAWTQIHVQHVPAMPSARPVGQGDIPQIDHLSSIRDKSDLVGF
jgi:hypothetical protein